MKQFVFVFSLLSLCAVSCVQAQQQDQRQVPLQVVSGGATLLGLKALLGASSANPVSRLTVGLLTTAGGLAGLLYPKPVLKKADAWHDIGSEMFYAKKIQRYGGKSSPTDLTKYLYYKSKNTMQGNKVPQWVLDIEQQINKK